MADMTWPDYVAMVEDTAVRTHHGGVPHRGRPTADLATWSACALVDLLADGLSLVYSFFDPRLSPRAAPARS